MPPRRRSWTSAVTKSVIRDDITGLNESAMSGREEGKVFMKLTHTVVGKSGQSDHCTPLLAIKLWKKHHCGRTVLYGLFTTCQWRRVTGRLLEAVVARSELKYKLGAQALARSGFWKRCHWQCLDPLDRGQVHSIFSVEVSHSFSHCCTLVKNKCRWGFDPLMIFQLSVPGALYTGYDRPFIRKQRAYDIHT